MDMPHAQENAQRLRAYLADKGIDVFEVCAAIGEGTTALTDRAAEMLSSLPVPTPDVPDGVIEEWAIEKDDMGYEVYQQDGVFFVDGAAVREIMAKTNPTDPDSMRHFQKLLIDFGIVKALKQEGAKTGDTVVLEGMEFDYVD